MTVRCARYKKTPPTTKAVPRGIARQSELLTLIERRFAQEDDLREAIARTRTDTGSAPAAAELAAEESSHTEDTAAITDGALCPSDESAQESIAAPVGSVSLRWHGEDETIDSPEIWLTVFDDVRAAGDAITREILRRRFHGEPYWKTCDALYLSPNTYYHHIREMLHYALACATASGILDPRPPKPQEQKAG